MRKICLDSTAPNGYHYDGEPGKLFEGKPTIRLRRDKEGTRDELYADLYCEIQGEDKNGKKTSTYHCTIFGCQKPLCKMNVTATGYVVFENFMKHLTISHPDYLFQADRTIAMSQPLMITFSSEIGRIALAKTLEQFPKIISIKLVFYRNNLHLSSNSSVNFSFQCIGQSCFLSDKGPETTSKHYINKVPISSY